MSEANVLEVEQSDQNSYTIRVPYKANGDWEQWFLLTADEHHDNPKSKHKLIARHMNQCKERGGYRLGFGDLFCVMQGKQDRRHSKSDLRPEHQVEEYQDAVVHSVAEFYARWPEQLLFQSYGNHESSFRKVHETDVLARWADKVARLTKDRANVTVGPYTGWLRFIFNEDEGRRTRSVNLAYHHGHGGGGPVTKGVIQTNRRAIYLPDANIVVTGHIHEAWTVEIVRERVAQTGRVYNDVQTHVQLPTYKEESLSGNGWHRERGAPPKPLGAFWCRFYWDRSVSDVRYQLIRTTQ